MKNIYLFLKGLEPDERGLTLDQIWALNDHQINASHSFIQKVFPIDEPSTHSLNKFYLEDVGLVNQIRMDPKAVENLLISKDWFLSYLSRNDSWQCLHNHNHLRITRIIKSLLLLVSRDEAEAFYKRVHELITPQAKIPARTFSYWESALGFNTKTQAS